MEILELKAERERRTSGLIKKCGVFFAFSNEQFHEGKTPLQEGEKYVAMGMGGYMPKFSIPAWREGMKEINRWFKNATKEPDTRRSLIAYELANHEAYYVGDIQDTVDALGDGYTYEEVKKVYLEEAPLQEAW